MRRAEALKVPPSIKVALSALQGEHLQDVGDRAPDLSWFVIVARGEEIWGRGMFVSCWSAHDVRGLSQLQRCEVKYEMINNR